MIHCTSAVLGRLTATTDAQKVPAGPHWAIVVFREVGVDDRWGNIKTEPVSYYFAFTDRAKWEATITALYQENQEQTPHERVNFVPLHIARAFAVKAMAPTIE